MQIDFNGSETTSLGVEMELELVDAETRELRSAASEILDVLGVAHGDGGHPKAKHELLESTIEIITGVCATVAEARADLAATLAELRVETDRRNIEILCSGTHPFSRWEDQQVSPDARYHQLVEEMQWMARRLQIFGIHVHVGVRTAEKAIAIANALSSYIPHFLGLSASSPFWMGRDTGLASARSKVFEGLPTAGLPYQLSGWAEFERFMTTLISAKAISSIREVWWDIRPHPNFGTVELRICDGLPTLREVASVAAMSHCLVEWMSGVYDRDGQLPVHRGWIIRDNKWRAARYGVDADIIVDDDGRLVPLRLAIADLVDQLSPLAERLGCAAELEHALVMAERPSYVRQREAAAAAGGSLVAVVDSLVQELHTDEPWVAAETGAARSS
ncbi:MAG TPA: glutamate--cysteine ligase [Acidimicrobiales bacterium]|nr:glutamate--cysteine ligase [Acidimicrobiales bacterium]